MPLLQYHSIIVLEGSKTLSPCGVPLPVSVIIKLHRGSNTQQQQQLARGALLCFVFFYYTYLVTFDWVSPVVARMIDTKAHCTQHHFLLYGQSLCSGLPVYQSSTVTVELETPDLDLQYMELLGLHERKRLL